MSLNRQPPGTPSGGEFAPDVKQSADTDLSGPPADLPAWGSDLDATFNDRIEGGMDDGEHRVLDLLNTTHDEAVEKYGFSRAAWLQSLTVDVDSDEATDMPDNGMVGWDETVYKVSLETDFGGGGRGRQLDEANSNSEKGLRFDSLSEHYQDRRVDVADLRSFIANCDPDEYLSPDDLETSLDRTVFSDDFDPNSDAVIEDLSRFVDERGGTDIKVADIEAAFSEPTRRP